MVMGLLLQETAALVDHQEALCRDHQKAIGAPSLAGEGVGRSNRHWVHSATRERSSGHLLVDLALAMVVEQQWMTAWATPGHPMGAPQGSSPEVKMGVLALVHLGPWNLGKALHLLREAAWNLSQGVVEVRPWPLASLARTQQAALSRMPRVTSCSEAQMNSSRWEAQA